MRRLQEVDQDQLQEKPRVQREAPEFVRGWRKEVRLVLEELEGLLLERQLKYGHGNISAFGEVGCLVRGNDKIARLRNFYMNKQGTEAPDESVEDTWKDMAGYAIIALMVRRGVWETPVEEE